MLNQRANCGVTLVELAIVVAILAIIVAVATPSYSTFIANQRIQTTADSLKSGLQIARMEALKRNRAVVFDMSALDSSWTIGCETPDPNDADGDGLEDCPAAIRSDTPSFGGRSIEITSAGVRATFTSLGLVRPQNQEGSVPITEVDITVPDAAGAITPLRVLLPAGGLVRVCNPAVVTAGDSRKC